MAKKKSSKATGKSASFTEAIGIEKSFLSERIIFIIGFFLLFLAGYFRGPLFPISSREQPTRA